MITQILTIQLSAETVSIIKNIAFIIVLLLFTGLICWINNRIKASNKKNNELKTDEPSRIISNLLLWCACGGIVLSLPLSQSFSQTLIGLHVPQLLANICTALYASSIFAILVTSFVNTKHGEQLQEIINKIDVLNNQDLYRPYHIYKSNNTKDPDKEFFQELVESILKSERFIYEGEIAQNATMCLKAIQAHCKERINNPIEIKMILREFDVDKKEKKNKEDVLNLFATIYFLSEELDKEFFNLTVYKRNSITANFVNLTDEKLFFSPFDMNQDYPVTYCYSCYSRIASSEEGSFYSHFKSSMNNRIIKFQNKYYPISDNDLFSFFEINDFIAAGYFGRKTSIDRIKKEVLEDRFKKREDLYNNCLNIIKEKEEKENKKQLL